jgi:hypothetical protein
LFLIPKAAQSFWNLLVNRRYLPEIKGLETAIVILSIAFIGLASSQTDRKDGIKPMYNSLLKKMWDD